jgi:hypothetical protein
MLCLIVLVGLAQVKVEHQKCNSQEGQNERNVVVTYLHPHNYRHWDILRIEFQNTKLISFQEIWIACNPPFKTPTRDKYPESKSLEPMCQYLVRLRLQFNFNLCSVHDTSSIRLSWYSLKNIAHVSTVHSPLSVNATVVRYQIRETHFWQKYHPYPEHHLQ